MRVRNPQTISGWMGLAVAITLIATAGSGVGRGAETSPFEPAAVTPASSPSTTDLVEGFEFAGYIRMGADLQVYLSHAGARRGHWLSVGVAQEGMLVEEFDHQRQAVRVRAGNHVRWLTLRGAKVTPIPLVLRSDRSIDWDHVKLSEREKEVKAAAQLWDLMEISRQSRLPESSPQPGGTDYAR